LRNMENKLPFLRRVSKRFPLLTILVSGILLLVSVGAIFSAKFDTDVTRLIPENAEKTSLYFSLLEKFGGMEKAYIVLSSDRIMDHMQEIEDIAARVRALRIVKDVAWKISDETKAFLKDVYTRKAPLLLSPQEMQEFSQKLSPEGMQRELEKTKQRLSLPGNQEGLAMIDPLNLYEVFLPHLKFSDVSFDPGSGYFLTPDKKHLIMIVTPTGSPRDIAFSEQLVSSVEAVLAKYRSAGLTAELTGSHAITLHEASAMKREIVSNTLLSVVTVIIIFLVFFRSPKGLLYVMTPVVFAIVTTMGTALMIMGSLSEVTGAFAAMIVGLGIDLGIVLYVRYLINMEMYADPVERMDRSVEGVYRGVTTGVVTTALTFLPMVLSSFKGMRDLGLMTGIGMLVCWVFLFSLVSLSIKPSSGRFIEIGQLREIALYSHKRPFVIIMTALCSMLLALFFIPRIQVVGDITKLGTSDNKPRKVLEALKDNYIREQGTFITETSMEMEAALVRSVEIKEALAKDFENITAAGDILPPAIRQKQNLAALADIDTQKVIANFKKTASEKGFDVSGFHLFTEGLERMLRNRELLTQKDIGPIRDFLDRLLIYENDQWRIIVTGNLKQDRPQSVLSGYTFTGPLFIKQELLSILKKDTILISIVGLLLVNIVVYLDFRNLFHVMLCQAPVAISTICTLGIMGIAGISLNFMNAIVFVLLFGIGTDYTIYLLHRYLDDRDIGTTFMQTGKAVLVAGLSTIAGFGSIGFSSYKGLATMGQVAAIGASLCVILSLTLVPALLRLSEDRAKR